MERPDNAGDAGFEVDIRRLWEESGVTAMLVHIRELFRGYPGASFAYPAFNTQNLETTLGIVRAAEQLGTPVVVATSEGTVNYAGLDTMFEIVRTIAHRSKIPVVLHFDHGKDTEQLKRAIELGYSSVMIDHSYLSFDQNVHDTRELVECARQRGAWVQAEIGRMRGTEDWVSVSEAESLLTDPADALRFYQATGVDTLACSVGTVHGMIKIAGGVKAHVDIPRIKAIHDLVGIPLVLHGASGLDEQTVLAAIKNGVAIINIDTELRLAFTQALRTSLERSEEEIEPRRIMKPVIEAVQETAVLKLRQFRTQRVLAAA